MKFNFFKKLWNRKTGPSATPIHGGFYYYNLKALRNSIKPLKLSNNTLPIYTGHNKCARIEANSVCVNFGAATPKNVMSLTFKQIGKSADLVTIQINNYVLIKTVFEQILQCNRAKLQVLILFKIRVYHTLVLKLLSFNFSACPTLLNCIQKTKIHA